jgi:hypothetical protein
MLVVGTLVLSQSGCSDSPTATSGSTPEAQLAGLISRTEALGAEVAAAGKITPAVEIKVAALTAAINDWRARTGRNDIVANVHLPSGREGGPMTVAPRGGGSCVVTCPPVTRSGSTYCFLESGSCENGIEVCVYTCITYRRTIAFQAKTEPKQSA